MWRRLCCVVTENALLRTANVRSKSYHVSGYLWMQTIRDLDWNAGLTTSKRERKVESFINTKVVISQQSNQQWGDSLERD